MTSRAPGSGLITETALATALQGALSGAIVPDTNGYLPTARTPLGATLNFKLAEAKSYTTRASAVAARLGSPRTDVFVRVTGGQSVAQWPNGWPDWIEDQDTWVKFPALKRRGAVTKVATANSSITYPGVTVPAATDDGDYGFLFLNRGSSTNDVPAAPPGWTFLATFKANTNGIVDVFVRTMTYDLRGTTLAPSFSGNSQRLATSLYVVGGCAGFVAPQGRAEGSTAAQSHATPQYTGTGPTAWLTFVSERSSTPSTGLTQPTGLSLAAADYGPAAGGSWSVALADSLPNLYPAGAVGGDPWVGTQAANQVDTVSIGLIPATV